MLPKYPFNWKEFYEWKKSLPPLYGANPQMNYALKLQNALNIRRLAELQAASIDA